MNNPATLLLLILLLRLSPGRLAESGPRAANSALVTALVPGKHDRRARQFPSSSASLAAAARAAVCPDVVSTLAQLRSWRRDTRRYRELLKTFLSGMQLVAKLPSRRDAVGGCCGGCPLPLAPPWPCPASPLSQHRQAARGCRAHCASRRGPGPRPGRRQRVQPGAQAGLLHKRERLPQQLHRGGA